MALETVTLVLGSAWTLVSGAATGPFEAFSRSSDDVLYFIGDAQPADDYEFGMPRRSLSFASLTAKVWAKSLQTRSLVTILRTVAAGNATEIMLPKVTLSAATFTTTLAAGADIATITGRIAGDKVDAVFPNDGRVVLSSDGSRIVRGLSAVSAGSIEIEIVTSHPLASNAPKRTKLTLTVTAAAPVLRGVGQGMRLIEGFTGGNTNRSLQSRTAHHANKDLTRFQLVVPVFHNSTLADTLLSGQFFFQFGLEYPFAEASAFTINIPVKFGGANFKLYDNATWDAAFGYFVSDMIDVTALVPGGKIPKRTKFGIHSLVERPAAATGLNNDLPFSWTGSNWAADTGLPGPAHVGRHCGGQFSIAAQIGANGGADAPMAKTAISEFGATQSGTATYFTPIGILAEGAETAECVVIWDDSTGKGVGSGQLGSGNWGDIQGDQEGNFGCWDANLYHKEQIDFVNLSKGSNGAFNDYRHERTKYRRQLRQLFNPTATIMGFFLNDVTKPANGIVLLTSGASNAWAAGGAITEGDVINVGSKGQFVAAVAAAGAVMGASAPVWDTTAPGALTADNGIQWMFLAAGNGGADQQAYFGIGKQVTLCRKLKAELPDVPILLKSPLMRSTSTDLWATLANQTADAAQGSTAGFTGKRSTYRTFYETNGTTLMQAKGILNVAEAVENDYAARDSRFKADLPNGAKATNDGTHETSYGYHLMATTANLAVLLRAA